jgi:flagellar hook-associated protein 2
MSGISGTSSSTSSQTSATDSTTYGTNIPPVTFPGVVSGIDYNSIINKLTSLTVAPEQQYNAQITKLTSQNNELVYINSLIATVQSAITTLSNPDIFNAYDAQSSNTNAATGQGIAGKTAVPGSYTIDATKLATSTVILGCTSSSFAHTLTDQIENNANPAYNGLPAVDVPLVDSYTSVTPYNSADGSTLGQITVDGVAVKYDVNSQSVQTILSNINSAVNQAYASVPGFSFNISYDSTPGDANYDGVVITSNQSISIGSANDSGNLQQVLKLDTATVNNGVPQTITENGSTATYANSVVSSGGIGGASLGGPLNSGYNANLKTEVTSGYITINGVKITIDASGDNINSIIGKINSSTAGVIAALNPQTGQFTLTSKQTGAQGIVIGGLAYGDTSNFLDAVGLTTASGATTSVGQQASVQVTNGSGQTQTFVGNSNQITTAIPGIQLNLVSNDSNAPFTINVTQDSSQAISAINQFVSAYNAAINEIDTATAAPVIQSTTGAQSQSASTTGTSQTLAAGGVLFGNSTVEELKNQLVDLSTGIFGGNSTYTSFSSIGLDLDSSFNVLEAATPTGGSTSTSSTTTTQLDGTSGQFQQLDVTTFTAALAANPNEVSALFSNTNGLIGQLGSYLTSVTGNPTLLNTNIVGTIPTTPLLQAEEDNNTNTITSTQTFIQLLNDRANAQANQLRAEFTNSEALASQYQSDQQTLTAANL